MSSAIRPDFQQGSPTGSGSDLVASSTQKTCAAPWPDLAPTRDCRTRPLGRPGPLCTWLLHGSQRAAQECVLCAARWFAAAGLDHACGKPLAQEPDTNLRSEEKGKLCKGQDRPERLAESNGRRSPCGETEMETECERQRAGAMQPFSIQKPFVS